MTTTIQPPPATAAPDPLEDLVEDLRLAMVSRALDDKEIALQKQNRVFFQISGAGHEALGLAAARELRAGHDWFFPYYRERALVLGLGVDPLTMLLQSVGAASDPASGGRMMPCHWGDPARHLVSQTSATGSQCLPAVGCAEAGRRLSSDPAAFSPWSGLAAAPDEITYVSLGEGATSQGEFWESLNTACNDRLPLLFLVADNGWAISVPAVEQQPAPVSALVAGFEGLTVHLLDGTDYLDSRATFGAACASLRAGNGPVLLHARVTRPYSHAAADTQEKYRTAADLAADARLDPIGRMAQLAVEAGILSPDEIRELRTEAQQVVDRAADEALERPGPEPRTVTAHVVALPDWKSPPADPSPAVPGDEPVVMADAIRR
jgi:2-oxoisovalerate dehydrogenase E1 component